MSYINTTIYTNIIGINLVEANIQLDVSHSIKVMNVLRELMKLMTRILKIYILMCIVKIISDNGGGLIREIA